MFLATFMAVFRKELLTLARNAYAIRAIVIVQLADIAAVGWLQADVRDLPIAVVDQDRTAESRDLMQRIESTNALRIKYLTTSTEQARSRIRAGDVRAAIVIPPEYGRSRSSGQTAEVLALVDGSESSISSQVVATLEG